MAFADSFQDYSGNWLHLSQDPAAYVESDRPGDTVHGQAVATQLSDSAERATLIGGGSDDRYMVSSPQTTVVERANGGNDTVYSWTSFTLPSQVENLVLHWGAEARGNDLANVLISDGGGALLSGGRGDDVLVSSEGERDVFEFASHSGRDAIYGFDVDGEDHDVVRLVDYGFTSFAQVKSAVTQVGDDLVLRLSSTDAVVFRDLTLDKLSARHFQVQLDYDALSLSFEDQFDTLSLYDRSTGAGTWKTSFPFGDQTGVHADDSRTLAASDNSIMIYVDPAFPGLGARPLGIDPFSIENSVLTITAERTPTSLKPKLWDYEFTSGLITTEQSFTQTYGYFEIRARVDLEDGAWPAFWLLPADVSWPPEIDVMENIGGNEVYFHAHSQASGRHTAEGFALELGDLATAFHTYGVLWTPTTITWYLDGVAIGSTDTPDDMHKPMYLLANLAVGGDWAGDPEASTDSLEFEIDYIRAYALGASPSPIVQSVSEIAEGLAERYQKVLLKAPSHAVSAELTAWAADIFSGAMTEEQAAARIIDLADDTVSVATLTYQFFMQTTPSKAGLAYLIAPTGGNVNNLNASYYSNFNLENRYINFAIDLGKHGAGRESFEAEYAGLTIEAAASRAYAAIFGTVPTTAKVSSFLDAELLVNGVTVTRKAIFAAHGQDDIGAKAAMVGWLLAVAASSDTGLLAHANEAYLMDLMEGEARQVDLVGAYSGFDLG